MMILITINNDRNNDNTERTAKNLKPFGDIIEESKPNMVTIMESIAVKKSRTLYCRKLGTLTNLIIVYFLSAKYYTVNK